MRIQLFTIAWLLVGALTVVYLVAGLISDIATGLIERRKQRVLAVLAVLLFESDAEAKTVHQRAGQLPTRALLAVIQTLAFDLEGQAAQRLRTLVRTRGLERHIRRRAKSWRWRRRIQAAQLHYLIDDSDFDRSVFLNDRHPLVRARAIESLTPKQAAPLAPELLGSLIGADAGLSWVVKQALLGVGEAMVPDLIVFLNESPRGQSQSGQSQSGQSQSGDALPGHILSALEVAAHLSDPRLTLALRRHCQDSDPAIRRMAVRALTSGRGAGTQELLTEALNDTDSRVRVAALEGLERLHMTASVGAIGRCLGDRSWIVRRAAGGALDGLGAPGRLLLRSYLTHSDPFARDMARRTLDIGAVKTGVVSVPSFQHRRADDGSANGGASDGLVLSADSGSRAT